MCNICASCAPAVRQLCASCAQLCAAVRNCTQLCASCAQEKNARKITKHKLKNATKTSRKAARTAGAQLAHSWRPSLGKRLHIGVYLSQYQKTGSGRLREVAL